MTLPLVGKTPSALPWRVICPSVVSASRIDALNIGERRGRRWFRLSWHCCWCSCHLVRCHFQNIISLLTYIFIKYIQVSFVDSVSKYLSSLLKHVLVVRIQVWCEWYFNRFNEWLSVSFHLRPWTILDKACDAEGQCWSQSKRALYPTLLWVPGSRDELPWFLVSFHK